MTRERLMFWTICVAALVDCTISAAAFAPVTEFSARRALAPHKCGPCFATFDGDGSEGPKNESDDGNDDLDSPLHVLEDLSWRVEKLRLEEANTRRFLKAGPRFLPYEECRKWVQAWNRWDNEEDWNNWIMMGEKRNAYIPARPEEYYGRLGQWISWDHFLGKVDDHRVGENEGVVDKGDGDAFQ